MTLLGLLGLLLAVAITTAATELTSQRIGLQEEPLTAGEDLVPATETTPARTTPTEGERPSRTTTSTTPTTSTATAPPPTTTTEEPESEDDDGGGRGRGRGRGRGGDDDD